MRTIFDEDGTVIGEFFADLLIDNILVIELKTAKNFADEHFAQVMAYLKSTRMEHALLINFGSRKFEIKKFIVNDLSEAQNQLKGPRC